MRRAFVLIALLGLAACRGAPAPTAGTGGVLVIATPGDADALLPPMAGTNVSRHVSHRIFPRLAELSLDLATLDDSSYIPSLARSWARRDSITLVFHLDPRARWQDGVPVTARDVAYTFGVYADSTSGSTFVQNLGDIAAVSAADSFTVVVQFRRWFPEQFYQATYFMRPLPRHLLDTIPNARLASSAFARAPVGIGPFRFVRWNAGSDIVLEADTGYFLGRPLLDRLVWRILPDGSTAVSAIAAGEADAIEVIPQRAELERAARAPDVRLVPYPSPIIMFVMFNLRRQPFDDRELRRALAMSLDRATIVQSVFGDLAEVPVGSTTRMQWIAAEPVRQLLFDTASAARTLDSLGWRMGAGGIRARGGRPLRFTLLVPTSSQVRQQGAVLLQAQWRRVGVDMRIQPVEFAVFMQRSEQHNFEAVFQSRTVEASPSGLIGDWSTGAGINFGDYRSAAFDSLMSAAVIAPTRERAGPLYRAALERMNEDVPAIFLFAPRNSAVIHTRYTGVTIRPDEWLATVSQWGVPRDRRLPRDGSGADSR